MEERGPANVYACTYTAKEQKIERKTCAGMPVAHALSVGVCNVRDVSDMW